MFLKNKTNARAEFFVTDYSGNILLREVFPFYKEIVYNSARITLAGKDSLLIVGGYSNIKDNKQKGCYSGIYTLAFVKNRFSEINTHTFGALLNKDSEITLKQTAEPNLAMNCFVRQLNGHVFSITNVFHPEYQYSTSSYRTYGYFGYEPPTQLFSGYRFLSACIFEFDGKGMLINEWFFPIRNVLAPSLCNLVDLYQDVDGNTLIYYVYKNEMVSQYMNNNQVLAAQEAIPVELASKADILEYSSNITMRQWYENNFLLSGYQYIKNAQRGKGKRYVFFINKLVCE
jgi:hypothetical protein